ncbi:MAG: DUF4340 domain-containing protein [Planctomycetia bacterium]|nr:DUF4340 domain-containing protein [Planctomycetia bacterium]
MDQKQRSEIIKSTLIGLLALVALILWLKYQPRLPDAEPKERVGAPLFNDFNDPEKMGLIVFTGVDPESGATRTLTLKRDAQQWRLPESSNFPAENAERLASVVAPLMQLTVLDVVAESTRNADAKQINLFHRDCGLLSPHDFIPDVTLTRAAKNPDDEQTPQEKSDLSLGAALEVVIKDRDGGVILELLVGNRAPESSATRDARFVRLPHDDVVYVVDFSGDSLQEQGTTEFREFTQRVSFNPVDWMDRDLLRISRWDIRYLTARDYQLTMDLSDPAQAQASFSSRGVATFLQTPDNPLALVWSLIRELDFDASENTWRERDRSSLPSANNDVLNETADALGALKILDARKKPDALALLFRKGQVGSEMTSYSETLADFGFAFTDHDPLYPERIEPCLVGEGGAIDITTKTGVKISLIFGRQFDNLRACLAYATFDRQTLLDSSEDEADVAFQEPEAKDKTTMKNERFSEWFYLIDNDDYQKIRFRLPDVVK